MSKYWSKMELLRKEKIEEKEERELSLYISQDRPAFFVNKNMYKVTTSSKVKFDKKFIGELSKFYSKNYKVNNSENIITLSEDNIQNLLNIDAEVLTISKSLKNKNNDILGSIISLILPIKVNIKCDKTKLTEYEERMRFLRYDEETEGMGCTSFLILQEKYRGKGYGMALIQESLQVLYEIGGLGAYFMNSTPRGENSIKIRNWCLNFPSNSVLNQKQKEIEKVERVTEKNIKKAHEYLISQMKEKPVSFLPSYPFFQKWYQSFYVYIYLNEKEDILGLYSIHKHTINYPSQNNGKRQIIQKGVGFLHLCIGDITGIKLIKDINQIVVYEVGDITEEILVKNNFQWFVDSYMNFFNLRINFKKEDIYFPLF